jgi:predicted nucleic acid-binding protein
MKTFFDANVLLEILLPDRANPDKAIKALQATNAHIISPLTVQLYAHFGHKQGFDLDQLLKDVSLYTISDFGKDKVAWAINNRQDADFEDALQVACALASDAQTFVTFDKKLAKNYQQFINIKVLRND